MIANAESERCPICNSNLRFQHSNISEKYQKFYNFVNAFYRKVVYNYEKTFRFIIIIVCLSMLLLTIPVNAANIVTNDGSDTINSSYGILENVEPDTVETIMSPEIDINLISITEDIAKVTFEVVSENFNIFVSDKNKNSFSDVNGVYDLPLDGQYTVSVDYVNEFIKTFIVSNFCFDDDGLVILGKMTNEADVDTGTTSNISTYSLGTETEQADEDNGSISNAHQTYDDYDNYGKIYPNTDEDYWKITFDYNGTVNFWMGNIPTGCDYDMWIYDSEGNCIDGSNNTGTSQEFLQLPVLAGETYYIMIKSWASSLSSNTESYFMRAKLYPDIRLNVTRFVQQQSNTCGPACARMILNYYGISVSESQIISWINNSISDSDKLDDNGVPFFTYVYKNRDAINYFLGVNNKTFSYRSYELTSNDNDVYKTLILQNLQNGKPIQIPLKIYDTNKPCFPYTSEGHYVVISGIYYNQTLAKDVVIVQDPHHTHSGEYEVPLETLKSYHRAKYVHLNCVDT